MSDKIYVGQLNRRVSIMEVIEQKSSTSGAVLEFESLIKNCWAKVEDTLVEEQLEGKVAVYDTKYFTIRFDKRCYGKGATDHLIRYQGEKFEILGVTQVGNQNYLKIKGVKRE
jgi:hypothetical protein